MALRLLALHGFGQNATVFAEKRIKELSRKLKAVATFDCLDAPHQLPYNTSLRGWWSYPEALWDGQANTIQALAENLLQQPDFLPKGLEESFELVLGQWLKGGYDGILGFSQGAILAAAVCAELHRRGDAAGARCPRFVIMISGFGRPVPRGLEAYPPGKPLPVPSLHVWGLGDDHIPAWASEALAAYFRDPQTYAHPGQHFVPQKAADLKVFQDFLSAFVPSSAPSPAEAAPLNGARAAAPPKAACAKAAEPPAPGSASPAAGAAAKGAAAQAAVPPSAGSAASRANVPVPARAPRSAPSPPVVDELAGALRLYGVGGVRCIAPAAGAGVSTAPAGGGYSEEELAPPGVGTYERLVALLASAKAEFIQLGPHAPCRTSEDAVKVRLAGGWEGTTLRSGAKAMLLRSQTGSWLLAVVPADCKLSWKKARALHGKGTRMATEEEVREVTGCVPGAVPPLAAAFPVDVQCLADASLPSVINFNCGLRTRSIRMSRADFERVQQPSIVDLVE